MAVGLVKLILDGGSDVAIVLSCGKRIASLAYPVAPSINLQDADLRLCSRPSGLLPQRFGPTISQLRNALGGANIAGHRIQY